MDNGKYSTGHKVVIAAISLWKTLSVLYRHLLSTTGRTYRICDEDYNKTVAAFAKLYLWIANVDLMLLKHAMMYLKITSNFLSMNWLNYSNMKNEYFDKF